MSDIVYRRVITFNLVILAWIFFRAQSLYSGMIYLKNMLSDIQLWRLLDGSLFACGISQNMFFVIISNLFFILILDYYHSEKGKNLIISILNLHIILRWGIYILIIFDILFFGVYGSGYDASGFLYGGF